MSTHWPDGRDCCSVAQLYLSLCEPMDCSMPGLPVTVSQSLLKLMSVELVPSFNHLIPSSPLFLPSIFPSIRVFSNESVLHIRQPNIRVSASASVLLINIQDWFLLGLTDLISLQPKRLARVFSSTIVQKHLFFGAQPSLLSNSHIYTWLLEKA